MCVRPCMYLCVRVQIHSLCVSAAIHTYEDTKDSAHVQEASSEEPTHNGYRISLYTFAAYRFAGFNSESRPGFAIDRSDSIVFFGYAARKGLLHLRKYAKHTLMQTL